MQGLSCHFEGSLLLCFHWKKEEIESFRIWFELCITFTRPIYTIFQNTFAGRNTHIYIFISMMLIVSMHTTIANLTYNFLATNTSTRPIQKLQGISSRQRIILLWYCVYALKHFSSFLDRFLIRFVPIKFNEKGCRSKT